MTEPIFIDWAKSTRSSGGGNCVEVGHTEDLAIIGVRDTKNRDGGTLAVPVAEWRNFLAGVKAGEFDLP